MIIDDIKQFFLIKILIKCVNLALSPGGKWGSVGTLGPAIITERAIFGRDDSNPGFGEYYN
jgi:hypothetical protein